MEPSPQGRLEGHGPDLADPATIEISDPHAEGLYQLPLVGRHLRWVREVCDGLEIQEKDSWGVRVGKQTARCGLVALATGVTMVAVF